MSYIKLQITPPSPLIFAILNGCTIFFEKSSVFGVTLHAANTDHEKKIFLLFGISPLEAYTEQLTCFFKNLQNPNMFGLLNINNKPEVKKT